MNKPDFYYSSDYAGLSFKSGSFYYGYEETMCCECGSRNCKEHDDGEWCFVAKFDGNEFAIPHSKLGTNEQWDVVENLCVGIGWVLAKYKLELPF